MESLFIGRQPIFNRSGELYGYELLHRRAGEDFATVDSPDRISADMLINAVLEVGIQQLSGAHRAFINVTGTLIKNGGLEALPSDRVVLEILEDVPVDAVLLARLATLHERKFEIALDDFVSMPSRDALIDHADIVKLDVLALDAETLGRNVTLLKQRGVRLLAEKIETRAVHARMLELGFDLFQGYFYARPEIYKSQKIAPNKLLVLELMASVNKPNATPAQIGNIIRGDVSMSVTVLRWANGPLFGLKQPVESIERAIIVLGLQTIRNWVSLMALSRMGAHPSELLTTLLVRARTCELLASTAERPNPGAFFAVGLLSGLDIILQTDMASALKHLSLLPEQDLALLTHAGEFGAALDAVITLETGTEATAPCLGLDAQKVIQCYLSAISWTDGVTRSGV